MSAHDHPQELMSVDVLEAEKFKKKVETVLLDTL